jgi:hypothetical protein
VLDSKMNKINYTGSSSSPPLFLATIEPPLGPNKFERIAFDHIQGKSVAIYREWGTINQSKPWFLKLRFIKVEVIINGEKRNVWINKGSLFKRLGFKKNPLTELYGSFLFFQSKNSSYDNRPTLKIGKQLFVLMTKTSRLGDAVLGEGAFKSAKETQVFNGFDGPDRKPSDQEVAVLIGKRRRDKKTKAWTMSEKAWNRLKKDYEDEREMMEKLQGVPHVLQLLGFYKTDYKYYFLVEKCESNLFDACLEKPETLNKGLISYQVAAAVAGTNERGIIHRDLKLGNVLITKKGDAKLSDFGAACYIDDDTACSEYRSTCPSPELAKAYFANNPEKIKAATTTKLDSWGLGYILYSLHHRIPGTTLVVEDKGRYKENWKNIAYHTRQLIQEEIDAKLNDIEDLEYREIIRKLLRVDPQQRMTTNAARDALQKKLGSVEENL